MEFNHDLKQELTRYSFKFFLDKIICENQYTEEQKELINANYEAKLREIKKDLRKNRKQSFLYCESQVGLLVKEKMLLDHFRIYTSSISVEIIDFKEYGRCWAIFDFWQGICKRKLFWKRFWQTLIKVGALLGIVLTVMKILEYLCIIK